MSNSDGVHGIFFAQLTTQGHRSTFEQKLNMLSRASLRLINNTRSIRTTCVLAQNAKAKGGFLTPKELVEKKRAEEVEAKEFRSSLLNEEYEFNPKLIKEEHVDPITKRPVPLNVELLQYKPMRLPQTHGHKVAEIKFRGYFEEDLIRASEFAARAAYFLGIPCSKVHTLKTEKRLYTVIKSPFAQAKSKENFHRVTFNRQLTAYDSNPEVLDLWLSYINKYAFDKVKYKAKVFTRESLDFAETLDKLSSEDMKLPEAYSTNSSDPIAAKVQELLKSDTFKLYLEESK